MTVPPLRERRDDIVPLALHYLAAQNAALRISEAALNKLSQYSWPGNVRELRNVVVRAAVLASGPEIGVEDLSEEFTQDSFSSGLQEFALLDDLERNAIVKALEENRGHQQKTATSLGISKRTLQRKIKTYGVVAERAVSIVRY